MADSFDVIVVGARCAGSTLATLLSRAGVRTLLLEASPRGTNFPLSTHYIQPPGMDVLDRIGVGQRVRSVTPPSRRFCLALDGVELLADLGDRGGLCPRRATLDPCLQEVAEASGADFRDRHRVTALVRDGERVVGVVAATPDGQKEFRAKLVVGADGPHSTVAKLAQSREYLVEQGDRGGYFEYYPAPASWTDAWDGMLEHRGDEIRYVFRCDADLILGVYMGPKGEVKTWGARHREKLHEKLLESPRLRTLFDGKAPVEKGCGLLETRYFYREPVGPGWALVGDAGHFKDFVTGQGMTDAFLDAERLSKTILDGRDVAFEQFWRERDVATMPLHFDALQQGLVGFNSPFMRWVISNMSRRPDLVARVPEVMERKIPPQEMVPISAMLPWMARALLRGRFDVLRGFMAVGKKNAKDQQEMAARRKLLADVEWRMKMQAPVARAA